MVRNVFMRASLGNLVIANVASNKAICTVDMDGATPNFTLNNVVAGVAKGYALTAGSVAATASVAITTGLTSITGFSVTNKANTATKANEAAAVTGYTSSGTLTAYRWRIDATASTLVVANVGGTLNWTAVGAL